MGCNRSLRTAGVFRSLVVLLGVALTGAPARAETFGAPFDPLKEDSSNLIRAQQVDGGQAVLGQWRKGGSAGGTATFFETNGLSFVNPTQIQDVEVTLTVLDGKNTGASGAPRAGIDGYFYRDGTGTGTTGDETGHVNVFWGAQFNPNSGTSRPQLFYFVTRCLDRNCSNSVDVVPSRTFSTPQINFFEPHRLRLAFDGTRFIFQSDGVTLDTVTSPDPVRLPATLPFMQIRTRMRAIPANTTAEHRILVTFDNVKVAGALYDDFSGKTLPRVQILPGSGTFPSTQVADIVILVETAGEAVSTVRLVFNNQDLSTFLITTAIPGTLPGGGKTFRIPGILLSGILPLNTPVLIGAEVTTASGVKASGYAFWQVIP